jgi:hypothetical protein
MGKDKYSWGRQQRNRDQRERQEQRRGRNHHDRREERHPRPAHERDVERAAQEVARRQPYPDRPHYQERSRQGVQPVINNYYIHNHYYPENSVFGRLGPRALPEPEVQLALLPPTSMMPPAPPIGQRRRIMGPDQGLDQEPIQSTSSGIEASTGEGRKPAKIFSTVDKPFLNLWGASHLTHRRGLPEEALRGVKEKFAKVFNMSSGGRKFTEGVARNILRKIDIFKTSHQIFLILLGGNDMRSAFDVTEEVSRITKQVEKILECAQSATDTRIILCSTVPDPRPDVDSRLLELDEAFKLIRMDGRSRFLNLRLALSQPVGIRSDCYQEKDIHLNDKGNRVVGLRIRTLLESMVSISAPPRSLNARSAPPSRAGAVSATLGPTPSSTSMTGTQVVRVVPTPSAAFAPTEVPLVNAVAEATKAQEIALLKALLLKYREAVSLPENTVQEVRQVQGPEPLQNDTAEENDDEDQMDVNNGIMAPAVNLGNTDSNAPSISNVTVNANVGDNDANMLARTADEPEDEDEDMDDADLHLNLLYGDDDAFENEF